MADYISQGAFQPSIPKHLITEEDRRIIEAFGISIDQDGEDKLFLFADDWCNHGVIDAENPKDDIELEEEELYSCLQAIIRRSNGELTWISRENAYTCTRNRPDGFGGSAVFVTADDVQYLGTCSWLEQKKHEAETRGSGPKPPIMCVVLDGGAVQMVITDVPEQFHASMDVVIIDTDVEGFDEQNLLNVPHKGEIEHAVGHIVKLSNSDYDLATVVDQIRNRRLID